METEFQFVADDGARINAYCWRGDEVRAVLQLAHGMGEHARRYREPLQPLVDAGIAVYANDHRGHGKSVLPGLALGDFGAGGFGAVVRDMAVLTRAIREAQPQKKVILFGHSMGSFAAQLYAQDYSVLIDGLALSGSAAFEMITAPSQGEDLLGSIGTTAAPRTPFDWLSRDAAEVDKYIADPLCGFSAGPDSLMSMFALSVAAADPARLSHIRQDLPIYVFSGEEDPVHAGMTRLRPLIDRLRAAGLVDLTTRIYPGARHEVLNEMNRAEVVKDLLAWLQSVIAKPSR